MKTIVSFIPAHTNKRTVLALSLAFIMSIFIAITGIGIKVEQDSKLFRAEILEKPATGKIAIVEIDAKSMKGLKNWPWPRQYHATLIDKISSAGAEQIVFDVDFSSTSIKSQDQALAKALKNSKTPIILPTYKQRLSLKDDKFIENLPINIFRKHALLASVNVQPNTDGQLNEYGYGTIINGKVRPSLASMLANSSGNISEQFSIDQSIDPNSITRFSFIDILNDKIPPHQLKGKKLLIGSTSIDLGDHFAIGRHGLQPGVVIQALAAETLLQNSNLIDYGHWPSLILIALFALLLTLKIKTKKASIHIYTLTAGICSLIAVFIFEYLQILSFSNLPSIAFIGLFFAIDRFIRTSGALKASRYYNIFSHLPNEASLQKELNSREDTIIAVAKLIDFKELLVVTNAESRVELFSNITNRLELLADNGIVYHLDDDSLAWIIQEDYIAEIDNHFNTAAALFQSPFIANDNKVKLNAAFGASYNMLDQAKLASETAKADKKRWSWYSDSASEKIEVKHVILSELETAIEKQDIWVVYQPKWDLNTNKPIGAEALVRWQHPERGMIGPDIFIPILETANQIDIVTLYVLQTSLNDFSRWNHNDNKLICAVNISAALLNDSQFIMQAIKMVESANIPNEQITFEVTETAALDDITMSIQALQSISDTGIKISIDDYGTGQSTMSYLQQLPIDEIKIDQSFVKTMSTNSANRIMVKSTIELAHQLNLKVVAEGIEDQETMDLLAQYQCDIGQGWCISKPVSADIFETEWTGLDNKTKKTA